MYTTVSLKTRTSGAESMNSESDAPPAQAPAVPPTPFPTGVPDRRVGRTRITAGPGMIPATSGPAVAHSFDPPPRPGRVLTTPGGTPCPT